MNARTILYGCVAAAVVLGSGPAAARTLIQNKGSDTLVNVAQAWAEAYSKRDPEVAVAVSGGGLRHRDRGSDQRHRRRRQREPPDEVP